MQQTHLHSMRRVHFLVFLVSMHGSFSAYVSTFDFCTGTFSSTSSADLFLLSSMLIRLLAEIVECSACSHAIFAYCQFLAPPKPVINMLASTSCTVTGRLKDFAVIFFKFSFPNHSVNVEVNLYAPHVFSTIHHNLSCSGCFRQVLL